MEKIVLRFLVPEEIAEKALDLLGRALLKQFAGALEKRARRRHEPRVSRIARVFPRPDGAAGAFLASSPVRAPPECRQARRQARRRRTDRR